jgi:predicted phage terminase large subunit-like protein
LTTATRKKFQVMLHPVQRAFLDSNALFRGYVGGRGAGKTFVGVYDLISRACCKRDRLYMVVAPTYPLLKDSSIRTFLDLAGRMGKLVNYNKTDFRAVLDTGCQVIFRSAEQPDRLRGPNISGLWFDEAQGTGLEAFNVALGCLREDPEFNWCSATFTPRGKLHWTYDRFARRDGAGALPPDTDLFHCSSRDNPFVAEAFTDNLQRQYTTSAQDQEIEGEFIDVGGTLVRREWWHGQIVNAGPRQAKRVRYWDKACLVSGTLVRTAGGDVPIEDVRAGDLVLTRAGYRRVLRAWQTKTVSETVSVLFSNGSTVTGTADHLVWTENRGWVELASLKHGDYNLAVARTGELPWEEKAPSRCRTLKLSSSTGRLSAAGPGNDTSRASVRARTDTASPTSCTGPSGGFTTATYPLVMTFTTRTTTSITTTRRTLNAPDTGTTCGPTGASGGRRPAATSSSGWSPGRALMKARPSSVKTARGCGGRPSTRITPVSVAGPFFNHGANPVGRSTAPRGAGRSTTENSAGSAGAGESVVPVYDLEVEGEHEFFANGVLVHNSTRGGGCYTCGVLMAQTYDNVFYVESVLRGQWSTLQRDEIIELTAQLDRETHGHGAVRICVEQEPGSGGKDSLNATIRGLAGHIVQGDRPTGEKRVRAEPFAAQVEAGNVFLVRGEANWIPDYIEELALFPDGRYSDQMDASSGAFNQLTKGVYSQPVAGGGSLGAGPTAAAAGRGAPAAQGRFIGLPGPPVRGMPGNTSLLDFRPR